MALGIACEVDVRARSPIPYLTSRHRGPAFMISHNEERFPVMCFGTSSLLALNREAKLRDSGQSRRLGRDLKQTMPRRHLVACTTSTNHHSQGRNGRAPTVAAGTLNSSMPAGPLPRRVRCCRRPDITLAKRRSARMTVPITSARSPKVMPGGEN